jgi:septation ring formation regulator EzrA
MFVSCNDYSVSHYSDLAARAEQVEQELDEVKGLFFKMDDEDEAEELYGEEIADLEKELDNLYGEMGDIDEHWLTQDYYASVL